jgi:predicted metal-dependent peptidase
MDAEMENLTREAARVATDGSITDKIRDATLGEVERTIVENS